jgi:SAM-dependent methyltransferase
MVTYTYQDKYQVVAQILRSCSGTLLDIGARDRHLESLLGPSALQYFSADLSGAHDFLLDLEQPLPFPDRHFSYVVALDVLEHVDTIHAALAELLRITAKGLILALPNLASYRHRWSFLTRGRLQTQKYDLPLHPPADRHKWLTTYGQSIAFVAGQGQRGDFQIEKIFCEVEGHSRPMRLLNYSLLKAGLPLPTLLAARLIWVLKRVDQNIL